MTEKHFFKRALWAPVLFPIFVWVFGLILQPITGILYTAGSSLMLTIIFAGIPYLAFVFFLSRWQRNKSGSQIKKYTMAFPIVFLGIFWLYLTAYMLIMGSKPLYFMNDSFYLTLATSGKQVLLMSYGYVAAAHIVHMMFKLTNRIVPERNSRIISQKKPYQGIPAKKKENVGL